MKRSLQSNNSATKEENEGASCSKIGSTHINNRHTNNADCNLNLQINSNGPEAQTGLTNETTLELVNDIMDNNSSIEIETKSLNENQKDYISWDDLFMATAFLMAKRSRDPVTQVGACIVSSDHKIVGTGYNEMPTRCCDDSFPLGKDKFDKLNDKRTYICHAELNAVLNTNSISLQKCIIYVSLFPCNECAKIIIQSGIKNVVYCKYKNNNRRHKNEKMASEIMFMTSNVNCRSYTPKQNITLEFKTTREPEKLQINADESETQIVLTNETTLEPVYDIIYNISSIETETKSLNENQKDYISWDDLFMATAFLMAKRSKYHLPEVGACIVSPDNKIVGTGCNGIPTTCSDDNFHEYYKLIDTRMYICHAEMNAVLNKNSISLQKCIIYVSHFPCNECAKIIIQSGIKEVVYCTNEDETEASKKMFKASGVDFRNHTPNQKITITFR
ncbi:uncharacterized protein LOC114131104 isoform X2 [Aphis gossypii]|uniref:uncharacterized protein LOC114131104 isoform X2 n=1 Tax=Aphis gossypii TaxID=80765 RepID=UPI002158D9D7|nr:uncharacterized protein LOC114131104 isoform X2 [Aphis gossypii]